MYSSPTLVAYRNHLPGAGYDASVFGGRFISEHIEDCYLTPWDLGSYDRLIEDDRDLLGPRCSRAAREPPHCKKMFLIWRPEDTVRVITVLSNHPDLGPMPEQHGIPFHHIPVTPETKALAEEKLLPLIDARESTWSCSHAA
jgi:hypothetical protein